MRMLILVGCLVLGACMATSAEAQSYGPQRADSGMIRCESTDGRTRECPGDTSRGIRMVRQISRAACIEGQSWGAGRGGVWVSQGCSADFASGFGSSGSGGYGAQVLRCESLDDRWKSCPADLRGDVHLVRVLSRNACVRNQTWGLNVRGIWVSQGCRAEFRIGDSKPGQAGDHPKDKARVVRCESSRGARDQCRVEVRGGVRMLRQLSKSPCVEGRSWGYDRSGIWVSQGCRADFDIGSHLGDDGPGVHADASPAQVVMRCESKHGQQRRCEAYIASRAQMVRQLSRSPCIEGQSWGWDRNGIWVGQGCRAEFSLW